MPLWGNCWPGGQRMEDGVRGRKCHLLLVKTHSDGCGET